jgi:hypothetical protein
MRAKVPILIRWYIVGRPTGHGRFGILHDGDVYRTRSDAMRVIAGMRNADRFMEICWQYRVIKLVAATEDR